ncbi:hypothetical protein SARC_02407 [Sphaeroforma arctica JP610]|uniref:Membrane-associated protein n=1 Tax=Sphaeroforma arctica JP610 TaxID=667725 RepID=A0A0L0GAW4_9EUKA|nr:hypothetical protein SARC_02407 [Sphaeroforma arctica JP610]KNC85408.1 hypothetical protein SARC_02407 [Sphaeroforma arctica JP610]|eukprot:XP_014159310.1 hypothetical protein SARC_02407 [Sphaeroforma arctica JP610]
MAQTTNCMIAVLMVVGLALSSNGAATTGSPIPAEVKTYVVDPFTEIQLNLCQVNATYIQGEYVNGIGSDFKTGLIFFCFNANNTTSENVQADVGKWTGSYMNQNGVGSLTCSTIGGGITPEGLTTEPSAINCTYWIKSGSFNTNSDLSNEYREVQFQRSVSLPNYRSTGQLCVPFSDRKLMTDNWLLDTTKRSMSGEYCFDEELTNCPVEIDFCAPDLSVVKGADIPFEWRPVLQASVRATDSPYESALWGLVASPTNNYSWGPGPFLTINGFGAGYLTRPVFEGNERGDFIYNYGFDLNTSRQFDEDSSKMYFKPRTDRRLMLTTMTQHNICNSFLWTQGIITDPNDGGLANLTSLYTLAPDSNASPNLPHVTEYFAFCTTEHITPIGGYLQFIITSTVPGETQNTTNAVGVAQYDPKSGLYKGVCSTRSAWAAIEFQLTTNDSGVTVLANATRTVYAADSDSLSGGNVGSWTFEQISDPSSNLIMDACSAFVNAPACVPTKCVISLGLSDFDSTMCNLKAQHALLLGNSNTGITK